MGLPIEQVFFVRGLCVRILTAFRIFLAEFAVFWYFGLFVTGVMFWNLQRCFLMTAVFLDFLRFVLENYKQGFWIFWDLFWKTINKLIVTYEGRTMFDAIPVPWCHWLHNAGLSSVLVAAALCISLGSFFFASWNWTNWNVAGYVSTVVFDICSWSFTFWCIVLCDDLRGFYMVAELP